MSTLFTSQIEGKIEISIGGKKLINESDLVINENTKYFLVGYNGCGKTTLLKYLYDKLKDKQDILMIDQDINIENENQSVNDFILNANFELYQKYKQMTELEKKDEMTDEESQLYNELSKYVYSNSWDKYNADALKILKGLGFNDSNKEVRLLSGGWRMRLALGKALLYKPNILLLDEPTNHLDLSATIWLTDYLESYTKTLIVITHQIGLLNTLPNYIWYISNSDGTGVKIHTIKGKYKHYINNLKEAEKKHIEEYNKFQKKITEMKNKSKPKKEVEEFIKKHGSITRPPKPYIVKILFEDVNVFTSKNIIELSNVNFSYDNKNDVLIDVDFSIGFDSRYVIVGENGAGKTTLFKLCLGKLLATNGEIIRDERLSIAYYNQQIIEGLPLNNTPLEYILSLNNDFDEGECRKRLAKIGIKKDELNDHCKVKINDLSGGQKARVALCAIQISNPHIILMDEPTNHLDIESIDALIEGINNFNGGIAIITHDMYLIESIEKCKIFEVKNNRVTEFYGDFNDYCDEALQN